MNVIFVSESKGKSSKAVKRVLDRYAERIGRRTWIATITEEGLQEVHQQLRQSASSKMAVACHRLVTRHEIRLEWHVGTRRMFNHHGRVRIAQSAIKTLHSDRAPSVLQHRLRLLVRLAALLHDIGKVNLGFQKKIRLQDSRRNEALRHELVSLLILDTLIGFTTPASDTDWLTRLADGSVWRSRPARARTLFDAKRLSADAESEMPMPDAARTPLLHLLAWLVVAHHRLPAMAPGGSREATASLAVHINNDAKYGVSTCAKPPPALDRPWDDPAWRVMVTETSEALLRNIADHPGRDLHPDPVLLFGRTALQLADHHVSSLDEQLETIDAGLSTVYANTNGDYFRQTLSDHLARVARATLKTTPLLYRLREALPALDTAKQASLAPQDSVPESPYHWQDAGAAALASHPGIQEAGFFAVVIADTGSGKTRGCAKLLAATCQRLRFVFASPLRSLTLQTGDKLRSDLKLAPEQVATIIGSAVIERLHQDSQSENAEEGGVTANDQDLEYLLDGGGDAGPWPRFLESRYPAGRENDRIRRLLKTPVIVATLDSVMKLADGRRGGHLVHALRVLSSDLIIDEVDMYAEEDLVAIGRLVHLAGVAGARVLLSSATLPATVARALFDAWLVGYRQHCAFFDKPLHPVCAWFADGVAAEIVDIDDSADFDSRHAAFVAARVQLLDGRAAKRCVGRYLAPIGEQPGIGALFDTVLDGMNSLHQVNAYPDPITGRRISIGVVQFANIRSCVDFSLHAAKQGGRGSGGLRLLCHHSQFPLLRRYHIERELDRLLTRNQGLTPLDHPWIRDALDSAPEPGDILFLVVTTLESTGRDHDYDWGIVEPTATRTAIQLAGRVYRHRPMPHPTTNIMLLNRPVRWYRTPDEPAYCYPGVESRDRGGSAEALYRLRASDSAAILEAAAAIGLKQVSASLLLADSKQAVHSFPHTGLGPGYRVESLSLPALEQRKLFDYLERACWDNDFGGQVPAMSLRSYTHPQAPGYRLLAEHRERFRFRRRQRQVLVWQDAPGQFMGQERQEKQRLAHRPLAIAVSDAMLQRFFSEPTAEALLAATMSRAGWSDDDLPQLLGVSINARDGLNGLKLRVHPNLGISTATGE
jgi:CRISPR-associated endonuclease/helicase Cas3